MEHVSAAAAPAGAGRSARLLRLASDERLVALVRAGEERAFEAIYDRHHAPILGFCRHLLGSREEAEDALQHTFLAAYRDLLAGDKPIDLRPWLFAIARNRCLSLLRARREHVALELAEPSTDGLAATVERREDLRELLADIASLPEDQRAALLLAELGALDHAGIASVLGCPREKVKALVFQARSSLAASREARATPCERIRMELATASGGELRRGPLRRHLRACEGCRAFKAEVAAQRRLLALALPVVPSAALKAGVLAGIGIGGHGGAAAGATTAAAVGATSGAGGGTLGGLLGTIASTGVAKVAVSVALAGAVAGGGVLAVPAEHRAAAHSAAASHPATSRGAAPTSATGVRGAVPGAVGPAARSDTASPSGAAPAAAPRGGHAAQPSRSSGAGRGAPAVAHRGGHGAPASRLAPRNSASHRAAGGGTNPHARRGGSSGGSAGPTHAGGTSGAPPARAPSPARARSHDSGGSAPSGGSGAGSAHTPSETPRASGDGTHAPPAPTAPHDSSS